MTIAVGLHVSGALRRQSTAKVMQLQQPLTSMLKLNVTTKVVDMTHDLDMSHDLDMPYDLDPLTLSSTTAAMGMQSKQSLMASQMFCPIVSPNLARHSEKNTKYSIYIFMLF